MLVNLLVHTNESKLKILTAQSTGHTSCWMTSSVNHIVRQKQGRHRNFGYTTPKIGGNYGQQLRPPPPPPVRQRAAVYDNKVKQCGVRLGNALVVYRWLYFYLCGPLGTLCKRLPVRHPQNWKYITYCDVVRRRPSHGNRQHAQTICEVLIRIFRYASGQTDIQSDRQTQTRLPQYFVSR